MESPLPPRNEPRHSILLVARRTGLTPAAIRAWERRYGAVRPSRTPTSRRLYSDVDVERLVLLKRATLAGRRIGSIARLSSPELEAMIREDEAAAACAPFATVRGGGVAARSCLEACKRSLARSDSAALEKAIHRATIEIGALDLMQDVLIPLLHHVGSRWCEGSIEVYQEHIATSVVRSLLERIRPSWTPGAEAPAIVVATPAGQVHEIGALMVAVTASALEWRVVYLGADLPTEEIAKAAKVADAEVVALSIVHPDGDPATAEEIVRLRGALRADTVVLAGGRAAASYRPELERVGAVLLDDLKSLSVKLRDVGSTR